MNKEFLKSLSFKEREKLMREELGDEKCKVLDKYHLISNDKLYWERVEPKYPTQEYFSHKFAIKSSVLGMIFHINRLCFAKTKYFENNWDNFEPCVHDFKKGYIKTELYNMEYIRQKDTGIILDLRELSKIHWVKDFHDICEYLEKKQREIIILNRKELA